MISLLKLLDGNERELNRFRKIVAKINALEPEMQKLTDAQLRNKTEEFKARLRNGETLDDILIEAYAVVREASVRTIGLRHFDVQLIGGIVLHQGRIAEMKTGEGKTLVATLPLYLNALEGKGCHLVTVNDYLAKRDREWMGPIYEFLGLTVGCLQHDMNSEQRRQAYACDITYGTNNEYGFDYLRDNMVTSLENKVQRELHYAIVDEVDFLLIDEARTPLIISGIAEKPTSLYYKFARIIPRLKKDIDYTVDEKAHAASFTEEGAKKIEQYLGITNLSDPENVEIFHHANAALRAHTLMKRDVDYVVKDGKVIIVDEFTGRLMYGRRFSEGLHQAIEAKEGVRIEQESQTLATITLQNYFRLYKKLAGMTGTAKTEEQEFRKIYNLDVVVIPTHKPMIRVDHPDVIYATEKAKFNAIVNEILECHKRGQPVLVGTRSIEKSEMLSRMLHERGIVRVDWKNTPEDKIDKLRDVHFVLNAKEHEHEAKIIARAGRRGAVTIATNMAGRGVDIKLEDGVAELGGLHIIGTERHEARRIDNQLRGRAGRQGDPGSSRFYVALEDELMRLFGGHRVKGLMERLGFSDDTPIEHKWITKSIENAQKKVEMRNFDIRKHVLEFDDVMETQRAVIYKERNKILSGANLKESIIEAAKKSISNIVILYANENIKSSEWNLKAIVQEFKQLIPTDSIIKIEELEDKTQQEIIDYLSDIAIEVYNQREDELSEEVMREIELTVMLRCLDRHWIEYLEAIDYLKEGITLRAYGQIDPLVAFKNEAYEMFQNLLSAIQHDVVKYVYRLQAVEAHRSRTLYRVSSISGTGDLRTEEDSGMGGVTIEGKVATATQTARRTVQKIGRNSPCPCGSGKKYKKCCGKNE